MKKQIKKITKEVKDTSVSTSAERKKNVWAGAQRLMSKPATQEEQQEQQLLLAVSRVLGVSPFGVNVLGGQPYINKLGLKQKLKQINPKATVVYDWIQYARDDKDKAICRAKIVEGQKDLCDWIVGECSSATMSMRTLVGYQNHMAQTRATNRAIQEAFGVDIHEEMLARYEQLYNKAQEGAESIPAIQITSAEEMSSEPKGKIKTISKVATLKASDDDLEQIKSAAQKAGVNINGDMWGGINTIVGEKVDPAKLTKTQASKIIFKLYEKANG